MPWYLAGYRENWAPLSVDEDPTRPGNFSSVLWAPSLAQAKRVARRRGVGERIVCTRGSQRQPYPYASQVLRKATVNGKSKSKIVNLHALSYLGMLALASGAATIQEVLGDTGFLHDFCHGQSPGGMKSLVKRVAEIEKRVPGYRAQERSRRGN